MKREKQSEQQRQGYIGGSDAAVIMGMNPWKNRVQLWQEKTGEMEPADLSENARVQWGIKLEDLVARHWAEVTGRKIRRNNFLLRSERHPWMAAHLDRQVAGGGFLEVKTAGQVGEWGPSDSTLIPDHYMCQVQHYMAVTGDSKCWVAVLIGGSDFRHYTIHRNQPFIAMMVEAQEAFWKLVQNRTPPIPLSVDEAADRWPTADPDTVQHAGMELQEVLQELAGVTKKMQQLKKLEEAMKTKLMNVMGEREVLLVGNLKAATWKNQTSTRLDTTRLKAEQPELAAQYMKESSSRVFRLQWK